MPRKKETPKVDPKPKKALGTSGSLAKLSRDSKGDLKATLPRDFGGVTNATKKADAAVRSQTGDRSFTGAPAPRVGGKQTLIGKSGSLKSASKKVVRQSRKKPTGSPQARASQKRNRI